MLTTTPPARVYVMSVVDKMRPNEDPVWGVFTTEERATQEVIALSKGGDWDREDTVFLIQGSGLTWEGVQGTATCGFMQYSGITVSIVSREVRP